MVLILAYRRFSVLNNRNKELLQKLFALTLLIFNIYRYISQWVVSGIIRPPVEFSALAYFFVPLILLFKVKGLYVWAAYSGLLAGGGYFLSVIAFGKWAYVHYTNERIAAAYFCHGILLLLSLFITEQSRFCEKSCWLLVTALSLVGLRTLMLYGLFNGGRGIFIYELLFAYLPLRLFGAWILPIYYIALFVLLILSFKLFFKLNFRLNKKRSLGSCS